MQDKTLQAIIKLKDEFTKPLQKVKDSLKDFSKNTKEGQRASKNFSKGLKTFAVGTPIVATLGATFANCSKDAVEFESAFTGVKKTLDTTGLSTKQANEALGNLREGILDLSTKIPKSASELAGIAEVAGQLGIQRDNILKFTETMARLADSTNIAGEEGALSLAKFMNVMRTSQSDVDKLGSVIVELGNNMSTTEADILNMATRLSDLGIVAGFTEPQVLAWASAMSSVGIEAEMGGTALKKVVTKIENAVNNGGESLQNFAKIAGVSMEQFKKAYGEDASKATLMFLKGVENIKKGGGSISQTLDDLGVKEVRMRETIIKLASANEDVAKALGLANAEWRTNKALLTESEQRYGTTESSIALMKNQIARAKIEIGTAFLPVIRDLTELLGGLAQKFNNLNPETRKTIINIGLIALAIGGILVVGGSLVMFLAGLTTAWGVLTSAIASSAVVMSAISGVIAFLTSPIGMVAAALGFLTWAWKTNFLGMRDSAKILADKVKSAFNGIKNVFASVKEKCKEFGESIKATWQSIKEFLKHPIRGTIQLVKNGVSNGGASSKTSKSKKGKRSAFGTARVVGNDVPFRLHDGEKILTKGEAKRYEKGQAYKGVSITVNGLTVREDADIDKIASKLVKKLNQNKIILGGV